MLPIVCAGCGELLDRDSPICRFCGEDNRISETPIDVVEVPADVDLDRLNPWSQIKHEIIEKYASAYTRILRTQRWAQRYVYIDAFAGAGVALDSEADVLTEAGALRALNVEPPFSEYHFIELDAGKAGILHQLARRRPSAQVHVADYRDVLPHLLTRCRFEDFARGLCLLDPYGLSVDYALLTQIAAMKTVEIFFNFMLVSANRNVLWRAAHSVSPRRAAMMTQAWGDESWREAAYDRQPNLFGAETQFKASNDRVIAAYRERLRDAGFAYVPEPVAMRNSVNAPIYYLFFCSPKAVAADIVDQIFRRYR